MATIIYPFGAADVQVLSGFGAQAISIDNSLTILDGITNSASGNRTINLTISEFVRIGAVIHVLSKTAAAQTTVFGTGITGETITGTTGKTKTKMFIYDGTTFKAVGEQID